MSGLALELVHEAWPGDPSGAREKSGFGSPVHHGSRRNRKELENELVTGIMGTLWNECVTMCTISASESCLAASAGRTKLLEGSDSARVKCTDIMFPGWL